MTETNKTDEPNAPADLNEALAFSRAMIREAAKWAYVPDWHMTPDGRGMIAYPRPKPAPKIPAPDPSGLRKRLDELLAEYGMEGTVQSVEYRNFTAVNITSTSRQGKRATVKHVLTLEL